MRKQFLKFYKIIFLFLISLVMFTPFFVSLYLQEIEYYPYQIDENNKYMKTVDLHNQFESNYNDLLKDKPFKKEIKKETNICIIDVFEIEKEFDEDNNKVLYSHGEYVMNMIDKRYDGKVTLLPVEHFSFLNTPIEEWNKCDVINYSMGIDSNDIEYYFDQQFIDFLKEYKGILVVAAGNEGNTNEKSQWSYIKEKYPDLNTDNLIIVTQGNIENELPKVKTSYGEMIDVIVFNYGELLYGKKQYGSSFATPLVSSVVGNLLQSGLTVDEVINKVKNLEDIKIDNYTYSNFDIEKMYE